MKRISLYICFLLMLIPTLLSARQVSGEEALQRVLNHWPKHSARRAPARAAIVTHLLPGAYVFEQRGSGYVVAPADDALPAILAFTDSGSFDETQLPPAFYAWLSEITQGGAAVPELRGGASAVEPLLGEIAWTQDAPMNDLCPHYNYGGYNYPTYAGCAAIAIGQIMRYHQHPAQGKGSVAYITDSYDLSVSTDLGAHTYDWAKILPNYLYTTFTAEQRAEVAKLVYDVAAAARMDFSPGASNTQDYRVAQALVNHFDYDPALQLIDHRFYSTQAWAENIREELQAGRPVYLSGANVSNANSQVAGHAFVVDGYNAEGYYHINWGWNGSSNGYYLLTDLTPRDKQGIGGSSNGYAFMQNAIIGIQSNKGGAPAQASLCLIFDQVWTDRDSKGTSVNFFVANPTAVDFTGILAMRITRDGVLVADPMATALKLTCKAGYSGERGWYVDLATLGAGCVFELVYKREDEEEWHVAGARSGSPQSLVSYVNEGGVVALGQNAADLFDLRLADLQPVGTLTAGAQGEFAATIKNNSDHEYFAPLYLMVYDADGALVGYTDYKLYLVPANGEAEAKFYYMLPAEPGSYHFCVSHETLGYNYAYSPMLREDQPAAYDYEFEVTTAGGGSGGGMIPDGEHPYIMTCTNYGGESARRAVKVRFEEGKEAYIQGLSKEIPEAWAHATIGNGIATFETPLLLGEWTTGNGTKRKQYITGADTGIGSVSGLEMLYDEEARTFTSFSNNWMLLTSDPTQVGAYYDHLYSQVTLVPDPTTGIGEAMVSGAARSPQPSALFDLTGRRAGAASRGLLIENGRKVIR